VSRTSRDKCTWIEHENVAPHAIDRDGLRQIDHAVVVTPPQTRTVTESAPLVVIRLAGPPRGKGRPRHRRLPSGKTTTYTPETTRTYEGNLAVIAQVGMGGARAFQRATSRLDRGIVRDSGEQVGPKKARGRAREPPPCRHTRLGEHRRDHRWAQRRRLGRRPADRRYADRKILQSYAQPHRAGSARPSGRSPLLLRRLSASAVFAYRAGDRVQLSVSTCCHSAGVGDPDRPCKAMPGVGTQACVVCAKSTAQDKRR